MKRCCLQVEQAGSVDAGNQNDYWLLRLGTSCPLPQPVTTGSSRSFRFRLTAAADLLTAKNWSDLPDRYAAVMKKVTMRNDETHPLSAGKWKGGGKAGSVERRGQPRA